MPRPVPPPINIKFFTGVQASEGVHKAGQCFAVIVADNKLIGSLGPDSPFRWSPSLHAIYPVMSINVREHHFVGNEKQVHIARRREVKNKGGRVPVRTSHGLDANDFRETHHEETWEYDLSFFDSLELQVCTRDMIAELSTLLERNDQQLPLNRFFGKISFKVKQDERPMRRRPFHGQPFTSNSIQAKFTRAAPKVKSFSF
ncbi:hypothetical protein LTR17_022821 [Elasticomyces elasticus]|nr:hypothetical protein LTR17_022821 [Elasticomyces elasticus]